MQPELLSSATSELENVDYAGAYRYRGNRKETPDSGEFQVPGIHVATSDKRRLSTGRISGENSPIVQQPDRFRLTS
jgi:hypothetical protein